mmetsp:Transcript_37527/g.120994  ORF Transcript_37527/g.120994 Transcript_37527/m.120994 type:complete len:257 (+) Transcript_37527:184-954(+)
MLARGGVCAVSTGPRGPPARLAAPRTLAHRRADRRRDERRRLPPLAGAASRRRRLGARAAAGAGRLLARRRARAKVRVRPPCPSGAADAGCAGGPQRAGVEPPLPRPQPAGRLPPAQASRALPADADLRRERGGGGGGGGAAAAGGRSQGGGRRLRPRAHAPRGVLDVARAAVQLFPPPAHIALVALQPPLRAAAARGARVLGEERGAAAIKTLRRRADAYAPGNWILPPHPPGAHALPPSSHVWRTWWSGGASCF